MSGYLNASPLFKVGDLIKLKKSLRDNSLDLFGFDHGGSPAVIIGMRSHLLAQSHVAPIDGGKSFDYKILISGKIIWVYEDEIFLADCI